MKTVERLFDEYLTGEEGAENRAARLSLDAGAEIQRERQGKRNGLAFYIEL